MHSATPKLLLPVICMCQILLTVIFYLLNLFIYSAYSLYYLLLLLLSTSMLFFVYPFQVAGKISSMLSCKQGEFV